MRDKNKEYRVRLVMDLTFDYEGDDKLTIDSPNLNSAIADSDWGECKIIKVEEIGTIST